MRNRHRSYTRTYEVRVRVRVGWSALHTTVKTPVKIHYEGVTTPQCEEHTLSVVCEPSSE